MDPDKALEEILSRARDILEGKGEYEDVEKLAGGIEDLHRWILGGGYLPALWEMRKRLRSDFSRRRQG